MIRERKAGRKSMIDVRDLDKVQAMRPFMVAHRGGVITPESPENSLRAIQLAAEHGYAMVEIDVMETADNEPILMHDGLSISCGVKERVCNLTSVEVTELRYRASDQPVITFAQAIEACADLHLGIMLDKLRRDSASEPEMSAACLDRVASLIREAGLDSAAVAIVDSPRLRQHLGEVSLFPISRHDFEQVIKRKRVPLRGGFWFGWAAELPDEAVSRLHRNGAFAVVSINTFHYPHHAPSVLAQEDIERLLAAGVDGFQIDSVYEAIVRQAQR
jgi:glycerophosphoryl diester phosphodiesterase